MGETAASVLVIDDDPGVRDSLVEFIEATGRAASGAASGDQGLAILESIPLPCLVLLDLVMPSMDGEAFLKCLTARPHLAEVRVIVVSAKHRPSRAQLVSHPQVLGVLEKPFDVTELCRLLDEHCPQPAVPDRRDPASSDPFAAHRAILVVDDDPVVREAISETLKTAGHRVSVAGSAPEALQKLSSLPRPCLIVLDMLMPEVSGLELLDILRDHPNRCDLPVLAISISTPALEQAKAFGNIVRTLQKPFETEQFIKAIGPQLELSAKSAP